MQVPLLTVLLGLHLFLVDSSEICCCPDLSVSLKCEDKTSAADPLIQTSKLKARGYMCDTLQGSSVTLQCLLTDVGHPAVRSVKYYFYKAYELDYEPIAFEDKSIKLDFCEETSPTCTVDDVRWSGPVFSTAKFAQNHNYIYQCLAEIELVDDTTFSLPSNTMWLDVYSSEAAQPPETVTLDEKTPLNTNNPYERLTCGGAIPDTNPPLQPKWSYKATLEDDYETLDIPNHPRLALVSEEIAGESKDSFTEGTLVLMMFNPTTDTGYYQCELEYITSTVGTRSSFKAAEYKISGNGQPDPGTPEVKMLSAITSDSYTTVGSFVYFTCYARDTDASEENLYKWVLEQNTEFVAVDTSNTELFEGIEILNHGRTLKLPSKYKYYGHKFKCEVSRGGVTKLSDQFEQPVMIPLELYVPISARACASAVSDIHLFSSARYMMSHNINISESNYVQKLPGASWRWMLDDRAISAFTNTESAGGVTTEQELKIPKSIFDSHYSGNWPNQKCRYFSFIQTRIKGFQLVEVLKVTRPLDNDCSSMTGCLGTSITANCSQPDVANKAITVIVEKGNSQCLTLEVFTETGTLLVQKPFDRVADKCIDREMRMMITKADTGETELEGTYKIRVAPEGASSASSGAEEGCVRMVDVEPLNCTTPGSSSTASPEPEIAEVRACPAEYQNFETQEPWVVNASTSCLVAESQLFKLFGVDTKGGVCYQFNVTKDGHSVSFTKICDSEKALRNLSHESNYQLDWDVNGSNNPCKTQIKILCNGSRGLQIGSILLMVSTLFSIFVHL